MHLPGRTWVLDMYNTGLSFDEMEDLDLMESLFLDSISPDFVILDVFKHKIEPQGMEIVASICESHVALATWPEHNYIGVDIFTCGNVDGNAVIEKFLENFRCKDYDMNFLPRGQRIGVKE